MPLLAVLPIKPFAEAKSRLTPGLGAGPRRALAEAMFADVLTALRRASRIDAVLVITTDHGAQRIAGGHGARVIDDAGTGHNAAAELGVAYAAENGFDRVLLVPGDCPMLRGHELDELIGMQVPVPSVLIVPDRHGEGTNALLLSPPGAIAASFGPGSRALHTASAASTGVTAEIVEVPSLSLDVDTPDDLVALRQALAATHGGAAHTRGMLNQLLRTNA